MVTHSVNAAKVARKSLVSTSTFQLSVLGDFRVSGPFGAPIAVKSKKLECLIAVLACTSNHRMSRRAIGGLLWSDSDRNKRQASLRRLLSDSKKEPIAALLLRQEDSVTLDISIVTTDLARLEKDEKLTRKDIQCISDNVGAPLGGLDDIDPAVDDWLRQERASIAVRVSEAIEQQSKLCELGEFQERIALNRLLLHLEPTNEAAAENLIRDLGLAGQITAATTAFDNLRHSMWTALEIEPSDQVVATLQEVTNGHSSREQEKFDKPRQIERCLPDKLYVSNERKLPNTSAIDLGLFCSNSQKNHFEQLAEASVAVLAPSNNTLDLTWDTLIDGLGENLCIDLYRFRWLKTRSYASFRNFQKLDERTLSLINAKYILYSNLTSSGGRIFLNVRLENKSNRTTVWGDRYQISQVGISVYDHTVTGEIASAISSRLIAEEISLTEQRPKTDWRAGQYIYKALQELYQLDIRRFGNAENLLKAALDIDPNSAQAHSWLAFWHTLCLGQNWVSNPQNHIRLAHSHATAATEIDPHDAQSWAIMAHFNSFIEKEVDLAVERFDHALNLNPNCGFTTAYSAATLSYIGQTDIALTRLKRYKEIMPFHPHGNFLDGLHCVAHSFAGNHVDAVKWGRRLVRSCPNFLNGYKHLISNLGSLGLHEEAKNYHARLIKLESNFTVSHFVKNYPLIAVEQRDRIVDGLLRAGVSK